MSNFVNYSVDLEDTSDLIRIADDMLEHVREEMSSQIVDLEDRIKELESENSDLEDENQSLEELVEQLREDLNNA